MNTKKEQYQTKNQRQKARQQPGSRKKGRHNSLFQDNRKQQYHEQELIATRMFD